MSSLNTRKKALSAAAAIAIAASGFGATIAPAVAQDTSAAVSAEAGKGPLAATFPADGTSTLTLHKRENPDQPKKANPRGDAESGSIPGKSAGKGYTFTLKKVADGNQLKDQKVFNALAELSQRQSRDISARINANDVLKSNNISAPTSSDNADFTLKTDENGEATQSNIPNGVYLVTETESPDDVTAKVHPFLVFLPQPDPAAETKAEAAEGDWNNNVHVYPKNGRTNADKKVVDSNKNVGDRVDYTLSATVPSSAENEKLTKFNIRDMFNKSELGDFQMGEVTVTHLDGSSETISATQGQPNDLSSPSQLGSDTSIIYDVPVDSLKGGDIVTIKVSAELLDTREDSEIINQARTIIRHSGDDSDHETKPVDVRTYVGDIELTKYNDKNEDGSKDSNEEALKGATFEIYRDKAAAEARANDTSGDMPDTAIGTATTGDDGKARFEGLHVTDFENNADVEDGKLSYYLVEVKAPDGFVLPDAGQNVRPVTLTRAENNTVNTGAPVLVNAQSEIPNVPDERIIPQLPVTGENGVFILGGAALVLLAGAGVFAARKNREEA